MGKLKEAMDTLLDKFFEPGNNGLR